MEKQISPSGSRQYLINIQKWRSIVGLIACSITFGVSLFSMASNLIYYSVQKWELADFFRYFTTLSNMLTTLSAGFIIPYAIDGIRKKRFVFPHWLSMMHYSGTIATTLTFVFAVVFILPFDPEFAIGQNNLYFHVVCPIAILISFEFVESGRLFSRKDSLICLIPFVSYSLLYLVMVVFIDEAHGGWEDLYMLNTFVPAYVSLPLVWILAYLVAFLIRKSFNHFLTKRREKMLSTWDPALEPVEINIEIYGLGRYYGRICDKADSSIPYDVIETVAEYYSLDPETLLKVYIKGLMDGLTKG
ncbi:MAG: hypothetical protein K6G42_10280 [Lachnospiraceae bacterium]|nr:hypothetical protein [Lachnospiraceae bacterium]